MSKNTSKIARGALLAKKQLEVPKTTPIIKIDDMAKGNRAQRRAAKKQMRRSDD